MQMIMTIIIWLLIQIQGTKGNSDDRCGYLGNVVSKGNNSGDDFYVYINGSRWSLNTGRGWNFVTFDRFTGAQKNAQYFDCYDSGASVQRMIDFINNTIDPGDVVCFGIQDEGNGNMTGAAWNALKRLGYSGRSIGYRDSYAAIGKKDGGLIAEKWEERGTLGFSNGSPAVASGCIVGCQYRCDTCSDAPLKCLQCKSHPTRQNNPPNCDCNHGFIDDGRNLACLQCSSKCDGCQNNINQCQACSSNTRHNAPTCDCKPNFYEDGNNAACKACESPCEDCSSQTVCKSCKAGLNRQGIPNCDCSPGHFDNGQPICQKCQHPCQNCSSLSNCISCIPRANIKADCSCLDDHFENASKVCQKCHQKCSKCSSQNICTECQAGVGRSGDLGNNCKCSDGYYEDASGNLNCEQCINGCNKCSNSSICDTCKDGYYKDSSNICQKCPEKCSKCSNQNTCTECQSGIGRSGDLSNNCKCSDNWYENTLNSLNCLKCQYPCTNCTSQYTCLTCKDEPLREKIHPCKCLSTAFEDKLSQTCVQCHSKCLTCHSYDYCLSCAKPNRSFPQCGCSIGFYEDAKQDCQQCNPKCQSCENNADNCIVCAKGIGRNLKDSKCGCQPGYYSDKGKLNCEPCPSHCQECESNNHCKTCANASFLLPLCQQSKEGHFSIISNKGKQNTQKCNPKCLVCKNENICEQCRPGKNRSLKIPDCLCNQGYHDENGAQENCLKCPEICESCVSSTQCSSCSQEKQMVLNKFTNKCECQKGFIYDKTKKSCRICYIYKGRCLSKCPPSTKMNQAQKKCEDFRVFSEQSYLMVLPIGVFIAIFMSLIITKVLAKNISKLFSNKNVLVQKVQIPKDVEDKNESQISQNEDKSYSQSVQNEEKYIQPEQNEVVSNTFQEEILIQ